MKRDRTAAQIIHHTAWVLGKPYAQVSAVYHGHHRSAAIEAALRHTMSLQPEQWVGKAPAEPKGPGNPKAKKTPCKCPTCEKRYTRVLYYTGHLPARIRCGACNRWLGFVANDVCGEEMG